RLEARELPAGEGHDRLVHEGERGPGDRLLERLLDLPPADQPRAEYRLVTPPLPLPRGLGRVQREVRVPQQLVGVRAVRGGGDADRDGGGDQPAGERERLGEGADDAL